jgi:hypothetical protein
MDGRNSQEMMFDERNEFRIVRDVELKDDIFPLIRSRGRKYASLVDLLFFDWPGAKKVVNNLYAYISENIEKNKEPVILSIVDTALDSYHDSVYRKDGKKLDDPMRLAIFVETLIVQTCKELDICIVDEQGEHWSVDNETPFVTWLAEHPGELTVRGHQHEDETLLREILYRLVASESVKNVFRRAGYEEAVLAGRIAPSC